MPRPLAAGRLLAVRHQGLCLVVDDRTTFDVPVEEGSSKSEQRTDLWKLWMNLRKALGVDSMVIIHISNPKISLDKLWNFDGLLFTTYHGIMVPDAPEIP